MSPVVKTMVTPQVNICALCRIHQWACAMHPRCWSLPTASKQCALCSRPSLKLASRLRSYMGTDHRLNERHASSQLPRRLALLLIVEHAAPRLYPVCYFIECPYCTTMMRISPDHEIEVAHGSNASNLCWAVLTWLITIVHKKGIMLSFLPVCCIPVSCVMTPDSPSQVHHHPTLDTTTGVSLPGVKHLLVAYSRLVWSWRLCWSCWDSVVPSCCWVLLGQGLVRIWVDC